MVTLLLFTQIDGDKEYVVIQTDDEAEYEDYQKKGYVLSESIESLDNFTMWPTDAPLVKDGE